MKKNYINPSVTIVTINPELPIAESTLGKGGAPIDNPGSILSRHRDDFDDFEDGGSGDWSDDLW